MYNVYLSINDFPTATTVGTVFTQIENWITTNQLADEVKIFTDIDGNVAAIISEESITLPSLVCTKQEIGGTSIVYDKLAVGLSSILSLPAETITEIKTAYAITTRANTGGVLKGNVVFGRRIA
jgi:hypothetical protein